MQIPVKEDIERAYDNIKRYVHRTPVLTSRSINRMMGCEVYFKCENFQRVGAFKFRGASNAVFGLPEAKARKGVCTHSSGNHGAALALAASLRGIACHVVMPEGSPSVKRKAVEGYGAIVTTCLPTQQARETKLQEVQAATGAVFIHPYDNVDVICGQGTASLELLDETGNLDALITPIGGGGLFSGTLIYSKGLHGNLKVYAGEPRNADDAYRSFRDGVLYPSVNPNTIADGLRTSLSPLTFAIVQKYADGIFTISEEQIVEAMRLVWERMKIIIEPSSAVPLAALMTNTGQFVGQRVGIIISGGNVELGHLPFSR